MSKTVIDTTIDGILPEMFVNPDEIVLILDNLTSTIRFLTLLNAFIIKEEEKKMKKGFSAYLDEQ